MENKMFECLICKKLGKYYSARNIVPHLLKHKEINGDTKEYMKLFPGAKLREAPKTNYSNESHRSESIRKSISSRTGKSLSNDHRKKIGDSNRNSEKYKRSLKIRSEKYKKGIFIHPAKLTKEKVPIPKDVLEKMYLKEKMSLVQIGREFNKERHTIKKYLQIYKIPLRSRNQALRVFHRVGDQMSLTSLEVEIIYGEILGDGCLSKKTKDRIAYYRHSSKHLQYVVWLTSVLRNLNWSKFNTIKNKKYNKVYYSINSNVHSDLNEIFDDFYFFDDKSKKWIKRIPKDLILTPLMLRQWFLGDGCLWQDKAKKKLWHLYIAACGFKAEELEEIVKPQILNMGINLKVKINKYGPTLNVYSNSFEKFYEIIGARSPVECYEYKYKIVKEKFPHLLKNKDVSISNPIKSECVSVALSHYRGNGFPFIKLDYEKRIGSLKRLSEFNVEKLIDGEIITNNKKGIKLANYYHPHRYGVTIGNKKQSTIDVFNNNDKLSKILERIFDKHSKITDNLVRGELTFGYHMVPYNFRPLVAKFIYQKYSNPGDIILDPCAGYGGRALGCMSLDNRTYLGVEPDRRTYAGIIKMAKDLGEEEKVSVINLPFEDINLNKKFSLIFTSPPYFNLEKYSDDRRQSYKKYGSYEKWKHEFLSVLIYKSYEMLLNNGYFCIAINNTNNYPILDDFLKIANNIFSIEKEYKVQYNSNPRRSLEKGKAYRYEPLLVFKKK